MQQLRGAIDDRAVRDTDRLMPQAHSEYRYPAGHLLDQGHADPCVFRNPRPGAQQYAVERSGVPWFDLVVAQHHTGRPKLAQVLDEVEDEAVVVVDDKNAHLAILPDAGARRRRLSARYVY